MFIKGIAHAKRFLISVSELIVIPNPINNWSILLVKRGYLCVESFANGATIYCHFRLMLAPFPYVKLEHYISGIGIK